MATVFDSVELTLPPQLNPAGLKKIVFAKVPSVKILTCLEVDCDDSNKPVKYLQKQWTTLKCRELIFTLPDIIATPELGGPQTIYIITSVQFLSQNKLQTSLEELDLQFQEPTNVLKDIYESCLQYTITARLAPLWNQVGCYYIQGREFLTNNDLKTAVRLDIVLIDDNVQIAVWPTRARSKAALFDGFTLADSNEDSENKTLDIENYDIKVYTLPNLTRGMATFLQTKLPKDSPFKNYKEMRRYWKNIYGYRLPEHDGVEKEIIYVTVKFNKWDQGFTYPVFCLQSDPLLTFSPKNETEILTDFISDLTRRIPKLCGESFNISIGVAVNKLHQASSIPEYPNLLHCKPTGNFTLINPKFKSDNNNNVRDSASKNCTVKKLSNDNYDKNDDEFKENRDSKHRTSNTTTCVITTITVTPTCSTPVVTPPSVVSFNTFAAKMQPVQYSSSSLAQNSMQICTELRNSHTNEFEPKVKEKPSSLPTVISNTYSEINLVNHIPRPKYTPVFFAQSRPTFKPTTTNYFNSHTVKSNDSHVIPQYSQQISTKVCGFVNSSTFQHRPPIKEPAITMSSLLKKETHSLKTYEGGVKKRSRPKVQADVNVIAMARSPEGLAKVNTTTLIAFLRGKGISCKVKDKKGELVAKVMAHIEGEK